MHIVQNTLNTHMHKEVEKLVALEGFLYPIYTLSLLKYLHSQVFKYYIYQIY